MRIDNVNAETHKAQDRTCYGAHTISPASTAKPIVLQWPTSTHTPPCAGRQIGGLRAAPVCARK